MPYRVNLQRFLKSDGLPYLIVTASFVTKEDHVTVFNGPDAEDRAYEYASWKYDHIEPRRETRRK
jgi:hypothetical protein